MQTIGAARRSPKPRISSLLVGAAAGTTLVVSGLTLEFAALVTPYVETIAQGRLGGGTGAGGLALHVLAIALGAAFLGVGAARLAELLASLRPAQSGPVASTALRPDEPVMAVNVDVGDGRPVPKLVVGRFGVAVVRDLPPASTARHQGPYWEARSGQDWIRMESPLDRASRDAERVRRWLNEHDRDYVVRVYAAVIAPLDATIARTPTCAVITEAQLEPWLRSLPIQRSLNEARRNQLLGLVGGRR